MAYMDYLPEWEDLWAQADMSPEKFFTLAVNAGRMDLTAYQHEVTALGIEPNIAQFLIGAELEIPDVGELPPVVDPSGPPTSAEEALRKQVGDALFEKQKGYFANAFYEALKSLWRWTVAKMKDIIDIVIGSLLPELAKGMERVKAKLEEQGRLVYDYAFKMLEGNSPVKPEDAAGIAAKLYVFAMGAGMAAHGVAAGMEFLHPLKRIGLHQTAALIGDFAGFGRITGATMGVLVNRVLGQVMTYAVQNQYRPVIPRESLLIEMRSKREIDKPTFDKAMGHQGFDTDWIDAIERWQWKDPRMFELMRVADIGIDQGTMPEGERGWFEKFGDPGIPDEDWWLQRKLMRAGYEDLDIPVLIRTIHRREISFAMTYVRTAIRRNYRWGYLSDDELDRWIEQLKLPEQAKEWIFWAGQLDRDYFYRQDLVRYYTTAFRNDVIDDDELLISLLSMGLPARESDIVVRTERVKKRPKPVKPVKPAVKKPLTAVQKKYILLYREQFRKGLISAELYQESLEAIGLTADLAEVSVQLEATKRAPALPARSSS